MQSQFKPACLPMLIGSLPLNDHPAASRLVMDYTPDIPIWVQLPIFHEEGMIAQFLPGMPGVIERGGKSFIDTVSDEFDAELLSFFEEYMTISEAPEGLPDSRFALSGPMASGFNAFLDTLSGLPASPTAVKGQVSGPITFCMGLKDQDDRAIFYNDSLRDAAVKHLALNARWQIRTLSGPGCPVIIFIDEPALAGFGSSEMISVSKEEILACLKEVVDAIHAEGGLAGIHVCANTDWSLVLESGADIVNFDAYAYFDRFILYASQIKPFMENGGIVAWGIVPTLNPDEILKETSENLFAMLKEQFRQVEAIGVSSQTLREQSLITPSCGLGASTPELATRVLTMTKALSEAMRAL